MNLKKYEAVFILEIRKVEDEGKSFTEEITSVIEKNGGTMDLSVPMGRRQFAREIKSSKAGVYWNYVFSVEPDKISVIKNKFQLDERILRSMIINYERPEKAIEGKNI